MAFSTALSGLNAAQTDLDVTSNNIANSNTTGFKGSRAEFVDVFAASFSGVSSTAVGSGVRVAAVSQEFAQGNIQFTSSNLDMAINGEGFFVLDDAGSLSYSRAGAFHVDEGGFVVNSQNKRLQVYPSVTGGGFNTGVLSDLQLSTTAGAPNATSLITTGVNLDATDVPIDSVAVPFDRTNPQTFHNTTSVVVYDSLGAPHTGTMYFTKTPFVGVAPATSNWEMHMFVNNEEIAAGGVSPVILEFDGNGNLLTAPSTIDFDATTTILGLTSANEINFDIDLSLMTQFGSPFSVSSLTQDGFTTGRLSGIDIDEQGVVFARFTNGQSNALGRVALSTFANSQGLQPLGDTEWAETFSSGPRVLGEPAVGTFGLIQSGALESSNVDIAEQLVNLITAQRNFQANAEVISTEDSISQTIINLR